MSFLTKFIKKQSKDKKNYYYIPSKNICFGECDEENLAETDARKLPFSEDLRLLVNKVLQVKPERRQKKIIVVNHVAWVPGIGIILVERGNWAPEIRENWVCIRESMYPRFIELGIFPDYQEEGINNYEIIVFESLHDTLYLAEKAQENVLGQLSPSDEEKLLEAVMVCQQQITDILLNNNKKTKALPLGFNEKVDSTLCEWGKSAYRFKGSTEFNKQYAAILVRILNSPKVPRDRANSSINNTRWWIRQLIINLINELINPKKNEN